MKFVSQHRDICLLSSTVCSEQRGAGAPHGRLQAQVGGTEPGPGNPEALGAAGSLRTQIWGTCKGLVGANAAGALEVEGRSRLDGIWSSGGEAGQLRKRSGGSSRRWGRQRGGGPVGLEGWWRCDTRATQLLSQGCGRAGREDFEGRTCGGRWRCGEALYLTHS